MTGEEADRDVQPTGPGLILMGGGIEPDQAFRWWNDLLQGGDVVILRASGSDGYNDYLYSEIGGVDSVETLLVDTRRLADDPYVRARIEDAEGVFLAGGDQSVYIDAWKGTGLEIALHTVWDRGGVIGGTSAGLAVLGERVYTAANGTVYSDEALADPFDTRMAFDDDFLALPPLVGWVTDSHFSERERLGRLLGFVARGVVDGVADPMRGIGVDERTALVVGPDGEGRVVGRGGVTLVQGTTPETCAPGESLVFEAERTVLRAGDTVQLPSATGVAWEVVRAEDGVITP
jgi:cyanophycinase